MDTFPCLSAKQIKGKFLYSAVSMLKRFWLYNKPSGQQQAKWTTTSQVWSGQQRAKWTTTSQVDNNKPSGRERTQTHLGAPDAGTVVQEGPRLADLVDVSHVPDIETVVVVDTRQLVIVFVQTHSHSVRVAGSALLLPSQLAVNHTHTLQTVWKSILTNQDYLYL